MNEISKIYSQSQYLVFFPRTNDNNDNILCIRIPNVILGQSELISFMPPVLY